MDSPPALFVAKEAVKRDPALQRGARGARKHLVTDIYPDKERKAIDPIWEPDPSKCPVLVVKDTEVAVFTHLSSQDRHYHKIGTEMYMVLEGEMTIEVEGRDYRLVTGDMIVVNPGAVHEIKPAGRAFLCRVVTANCGGGTDKFLVTER